MKKMWLRFLKNSTPTTNQLPILRSSIKEAPWECFVYQFLSHRPMLVNLLRFPEMLYYDNNLSHNRLHWSSTVLKNCLVASNPYPPSKYTWKSSEIFFPRPPILKCKESRISLPAPDQTQLFAHFIPYSLRITTLNKKMMYSFLILPTQHTKTGTFKKYFLQDVPCWSFIFQYSLE